MLESVRVGICSGDPDLESLRHGSFARPQRKGFAVARFMLGLGETGIFPATLKAQAEWVPQQERALMTGIFNSGTNVGAILAPLWAPWIAVLFGWQWAFLFTGILSAVWLIASIVYRKPAEHPGLFARELPTFQLARGSLAKGSPGSALCRIDKLGHSFIGKFSDPIWWFFPSWLPKFLHARHGLTLTELGLPLVVIYLSADGGSIAGLRPGS